MVDSHQKKKIRIEGQSDYRPWADLFPDALVLIFKALTLQELFKVIPRVCKSWRKVVEEPYCWQTVDIVHWSANYSKKRKPYKIDRMLRTLIPRSSSSLRELRVGFLNDDHMLFIAEHIGNVQTLALQYCSLSDSIIDQVATKFSSVTSLDLSCSKISSKALRVIGSNCENLTSLTWTMEKPLPCYECWERPPPTKVYEARAIANTMPKLKSLNLSQVDIDTQLALEILSGCVELEFLDIQGCWAVDEEVLKEKYPKIKVLGNGGEDDSDGSYVWDTWNDISPGYSSGDDDDSWMIDRMIEYYSL